MCNSLAFHFEPHTCSLVASASAKPEMSFHLHLRSPGETERNIGPVVMLIPFKPTNKICASASGSACFSNGGLTSGFSNKKADVHAVQALPYSKHIQKTGRICLEILPFENGQNRRVWQIPSLVRLLPAKSSSMRF